MRRAGEGSAGNGPTLNVLLAGLCFAAWKAPRWVVKEIGAFALVFGFFSMILGVRQVLDFLQGAGNGLPLSVISGGLKVTLIPVLYGMIIYLVSLVIRIFQKPRL